MKRPAVLVSGAVGILLAGFVGVAATRDSATTRESDSPLLGRPAPAIGGETIDGVPVRLSQFRGRYVLVNFFATWCVPCQREHPELVRFRQRHQDDAEVLAVIFDDEVGAVRRFFERKPGGWPVVVDRSGKVALDYGVRGPPESFLVDPDGFVLTKIIGEVDADGLDALLRRAKARP